MNDLVDCPFCGESDFDLVGLKSHLQNGDCEGYENTETLVRIFRGNLGDTE